MATGREALRVQLIAYTCSQNCMGVRGNSGGVCTLDDRDFIPGPARDADAFLADLGRRLGREVSRDEAFIDFDEGRALFPERPTRPHTAQHAALLPGAPAVAGARQLPSPAGSTGRGLDSVPVLR